MDQHVPPKLNKDAFNCPYCGAYAHQSWYPIGAVGEVIRSWGLPGDGLYLDHPIILHGISASSCFHCKKIAIWDGDGILIPKTINVPSPSDDLPVDVKKMYNEAGSVLNDSARASGALMRLALEALLKKVGNSDKGLYENIDEITSRSNLPAEIRDALHIIRVNGNNAVHVGQIGLSEKREDVLFLFDLFNMITEELVTRPKKIKDTYNKLPESIRKQIESKR